MASIFRLVKEYNTPITYYSVGLDRPHPVNDLPLPTHPKPGPERIGRVCMFHHCNSHSNFRHEAPFCASRKQYVLDRQTGEGFTGDIRGHESYQIFCMGGSFPRESFWVQERGDVVNLFFFRSEIQVVDFYPLVISAH